MTLRSVATLASAFLVTTAMTAAIVAAPATASDLDSAASSSTDPDADWTSAWGTSVQPPYDDAGSESNWSDTGFENQTVRQVVRLGNGGESLRIRISNAYGDRPLHLAGATVARTEDGAAVDGDSVRRLEFDERKSTVIAPGKQRYSDPVALPTEPLESVTVTFWLERATGPATYHSLAYATSFRAEGDRLRNTDGTGFDDTSTSWYYLNGVEVAGASNPDAVVALGDSITDGVVSQVDANNRWPDELTERLAETDSPMAVVNAGISGNRLLNPSPCFGDTAADRFERDVLSRPGVATLIVLEGINDLGHSEQTGPCVEPNPEATADQLIEAHQELIDRAHAEGIQVVGATLLPYRGADYFTERGERERQQLNTWIRESGAYDAVVDFDRAVADPEHPDQMDPAYDSGDGLHPNEAGMRAMANAVDLSVLSTGTGMRFVGYD